MWGWGPGRPGTRSQRDVVSFPSGEGPGAWTLDLVRPLI